MNIGRAPAPDGAGDAGHTSEAPRSAVAWGPIIAGGVTATAVTMILLELGVGLGFAAASPFHDNGPSATSVAVMGFIWLVVTQWAAAGMGGYLTGRLRTKWVATHTHEVFFRDTAHGLLSWAVATVVTVFLIASAASSMVGSGVQAAASIGSGAAQGAASAVSEQARQYDMDALFRRSQPDANAPAGDIRAEASRILAGAVISGDVPAADRTYLADQVSARAGIPAAEARQRVDDIVAKTKQAADAAKQAAEAARKATATLAIFTALAMLVGAFIASVAAAIGGQQRDEY